MMQDDKPIDVKIEIDGKRVALTEEKAKKIEGIFQSLFSPEELEASRAFDERRKTLPPLYTVVEIRDMLMAGKLNLNIAGHNQADTGFKTYDGKTATEYYREHLLERLDDYIEITESMIAEATDEGGREFSSRDLTRRYKQDDGIAMIDFCCHECGATMHYALQDASTITVVSRSRRNRLNTDNTCPLKDGVESFSFDIKVTSGKLVFANVFDDRVDGDRNNERFEPEDKYGQEFSLNSTLGRMNLTRHYAEKHNIAYAQMGNMSIGLFINEQHDKIIVGKHWDCEEIEGCKKVGEISLAVWRWMATDIEVLKANNIPMTREHYCNDEDFIVLDVPIGTYRVTNYFDYERGSEDESPVYSTLEKIY